MVGYVISHMSEEVWVDVIKGRAKRRKCFKMEGVTNSLEFWGTEKHGQRAVSSLETQIAPQEHFEWVVGVGSWLQRTEARGQRGGEGTEPLRFSLFPHPERLCQFLSWRVYSNLLPILMGGFSFH